MLARLHFTTKRVVAAGPQLYRRQTGQAGYSMRFQVILSTRSGNRVKPLMLAFEPVPLKTSFSCTSGHYFPSRIFRKGSCPLAPKPTQTDNRVGNKSGSWRSDRRFGIDPLAPEDHLLVGLSSSSTAAAVLMASVSVQTRIQPPGHLFNRSFLSRIHAHGYLPQELIPNP